MQKEQKINKRLENEINHGKFLVNQGAGKIWNWESPAGKRRWKRRVNLLTSHIKPSMKLLELGCGTVYFTKEIIKINNSLTAIDISPDLINIAKNTITHNSNNVIFKIENAYSMSFPNHSFDCVVGSSILHHLEIDDAFKEIFRVLKPGGKIYFTEPNMMNPQIALQKNIPYIKKRLGDSPDETAFYRWPLKKRLIELGFVNIKIIPFDFLHPAIPKLLINIIIKIGNFTEKIPILREIAGSLFITAQKPQIGNKNI